MEIVKVGMLGVAGVMLALQFKGTRPEIGVYVGLAICLLILGFSVEGFSFLLEQMQPVRAYLGEDGSYLGLLLKAVGITYICEFAAAICKDAGYSGVAGQIEIFGKLSVLVLGMPVLTAVVENISAIGR